MRSYDSLVKTVPEATADMLAAVRRTYGYSGVYLLDRDLRLLFVAQVISFMGDWFSFVALASLVHEATGSEFLVSVAYVSFSLPSFLASPIAGPVVDRFDRRRLPALRPADDDRLLLAHLPARRDDRHRDERLPALHGRDRGHDHRPRSRRRRPGRPDDPGLQHDRADRPPAGHDRADGGDPADGRPDAAPRGGRRERRCRGDALVAQVQVDAHEVERGGECGGRGERFAQMKRLGLHTYDAAREAGYPEGSSFHSNARRLAQNYLDFSEAS